jgi:hypothetical protein
MLRSATLTFLVCVLSTADAAAQLGPSPSGQFRAGGTFYEKFFQEPDDGPRQDVWAALMEIRFEDPLANRLRAYTRIELLQYRELGSSPGVRVGVRRRGRSHTLDTYGTMRWNRPRSDVGDELEKADQLGGGASYTYRIIAGLQLSGQAEYREEFLKTQRVTGSRFHEFGGALGYRAFGGRVSPEVAFLRGTRRTSSVSGAYVQDTTSMRIRSSVVPRVSLNARYRHRLREYTIREATSRNFGREDRRQQLGADVDISLGSNLILNLSGAVEKGWSTRPGRAFVARTFGAGFTRRY